MINVAVKAARAAGSLINRAALDIESVRVSSKQVNDFVTEVDVACEKTIIETLLTAYPGHGIWAEESGTEFGANTVRRTLSLYGSSTRWTAPPTSSTACPCIASASLWP
jgi:fructose-1,6-bisphosphatase/inositol monophosphatase family enzyme